MVSANCKICIPLSASRMESASWLRLPIGSSIRALHLGIFYTQKYKTTKKSLLFYHQGNIIIFDKDLRSSEGKDFRRSDAFLCLANPAVVGNSMMYYRKDESTGRPCVPRGIRRYTQAWVEQGNSLPSLPEITQQSTKDTFWGGSNQQPKMRKSK